MNNTYIDIQLLQENRTSDRQRVVHYFRYVWKMVLGFGGLNCRVMWQLSSVVKWIRYSQGYLAFRVKFLGLISPSFPFFYSTLFVCVQVNWNRRDVRCSRSWRLAGSPLSARTSRSQSRSHSYLCCVRPHGLSRNLRETARSLKFNLTSWKQCRVLNIRGAQYSGTSI